ncbi:MAG: DUF4038 domain-containing protein [Clostridia bacterium]|nr:DUF4038 domain-containing protein [Clostridia bacterium]
MMKTNQMFELSFENIPAGGEIIGKFLWNGKEMSIPGFYAGNGVYKLRFLPKEAGEYHWEISGAVQAEGTEICEESGLPGMVRADGKAFRYENGRLFHPFGTTVYALISQTDELIEQTMRTLEQSPFNKLRMCVFPKDYDFNKNEPAYYAFERSEDGTWDPSRPVYAFWDALDRHVQRLGQMGMQIDLILFHPYDRWGFDGMGIEKDKQYLDYLLRRLSAYPHIWWSLANEYELTKRTMEEWYEIEAFVSANDPYGHLLSCHNIFHIWDANRPLTTHASIQSKDMSKLKDWCDRYDTPVMLDECAYEGNLQYHWGCITGEEMSRRFWEAVCSGAYCTHGETFYSEDEILWWARGGVLKGKSPQRIAFCREIIESLPGHLEGEASSLNRLLPLMKMSETEREAQIAAQKGVMQRFVRAFIDSGEDAQSFGYSQPTYYGHIGTECYLRFYDTRPIAKDILELPSDRTYTIRLIDTWNMTQQTLAQGVSGTYTVALPGRENMAVLALAE